MRRALLCALLALAGLAPGRGGAAGHEPASPNYRVRGGETVSRGAVRLASRAAEPAFGTAMGSAGESSALGVAAAPAREVRPGFWNLLAFSPPAVCGDGFVDPAEQCDDGNTAGGDGCSALCVVSVVHRLALHGEAVGGLVGITFAGGAVDVPTWPGQSAADVVAALADAINAEASLAASGVYAFAAGNVLHTSGVVAGVLLGDPGLAQVLLVPALRGPLPAALLALLLAAGLCASRRLRAPPS